MPAAVNRHAAFRLTARLCFALTALLLLPLSLGAQASPHWLTGYYAIYNYNGVMTTSQVDYTKLSHVIYWPVIPNTGKPGTLDTTAYVSSTTFAAGANDLVTRAHAAGAKALIGIGGDDEAGPGDQGLGATAGFQISTEPANQATFISNIVALMQQYGFDGVDINWEQIRNPQDNSDFTTFIANLRAALNAVSPNLLLTMAPETQQNGGRPDLLAQVYQDLNQINIQTYQMSGPYCGWVTWYNSPLNPEGDFPGTTEALPSITGAVSAYTALGIPQGKLAMGIQFDGEVWKGGQGTSTGGVTKPLQSWSNESNCGNNPDAPSTGIATYTSLIPLLTTAGYTNNFDSTADQSWLSYDPSGTGTTNEANDEFISYDSPTSLAKKGVDLSAGAGVGGSLGGAFMFELSGDYVPTATTGQQHPLLNAANAMQFLLPGAASGLSASTPAKGEVVLTWTAAPFAAGYKVYTLACAGCPGTNPQTVAATTATITGLTAGTEYWFTVIPYNAFGSSTSLETSATPTGIVAPAITWSTPAAIAYPTPLSATQLNATATSGGTTVAGTFVYSPAIGTVLTAGSHTLSVTFTPTNTSAYSSATASVMLQVVLGTPVLTWGQLAPIAYPTPLTATQLNATSNVPGTIGYQPGLGTVLPIGTDTIFASFTPTDTSDYESLEIARQITVTGTLSTPTITWPQPASIPFGTELSSTQLNATANVAGSFTYSPAAGTLLPVGSNTLSATFTPSVANYASASKSVTLTVTAATLSTSASFGSLNVGAVSVAHQFSYTLTSATALSAVQVLTKGAPGLDFQAAGTGSCKIGTTYPIGTICTVDVVFSPTATGFREGAVVFEGASGAPLQTTYLTGTGNGSQVAFDPGAFSSWTPPAQFEPFSLVVDGAGNTFAADYSSSKIYKITSAGYFSTYLTPTTTASSQLALDGAGNLYYMNSTSVVEVYPNLTTKTLVTGLTASPKGLAVDAAGNVYVANSNANAIWEYTPSNGKTTILSIPKIAGLALSLPCGLALDNNGNLYIGDAGNHRVVEVSLASLSTSSVVATVSGAAEAIQLAAGNNGNLYIADGNGGQILKWNSSTPSVAPIPLLIGSILGKTLAPVGVAVDSSENLYVADLSNERVLVDNRKPGWVGLAFASTPVGTVSSDSPRTLTVDNIGNAALSFTPPASGSNPAVSSQFPLGTASTCPILTSTSAAKSLASLASCTYLVNFKPASASSNTGTLVLTDNASNLPTAPQQTIYLSGTGLAPVAATVTLSGLAATYTGSPIAATATTNPAGLAVSITYNGAATAPTAAGSYAVVATITAPGYTGSATGNLVISPATPQIAWAAPAAVPYGTPLSATQLDATANVAGTFVYSPAAGAIPAVGTDTLTVTFTPTNTEDYKTAMASVSLTVTAANLSNGPDFTNQPVGQPSVEHSFTFNFSAATTLQTGNPVNVLTIASPNLDFVNTGTGTCKAGTYAAGSSCTVNVLFNPSVSGVRNGAISLLTSGSVPGKTAYITGNGLGAQLAFDPGTPTAWSPPSQFTPFGIAVDGQGNTYVANYGGASALAIYKITPAGAFSTYVPALASAAYEMVLDPAGTLYYTTTTSVVKVTSALASTTIISGLVPAPKGLAVDTSGNVFVANTIGNNIMEYNPTTNTTITLSIPKIAGLALNLPCGLAVDQFENLYIADAGNNRIVKVPVATPASSTVVYTRTGATEIMQLAIGNNGSLYITDPNNNQVLKWNPTTPTATPVVLYSGTILGFQIVPFAVALDGSENLYISDDNAAKGRVLFINRTAAGANLAFASSAVGVTSPDSPRTVTLLNIGSNNLTFTVPATGQNPLLAGTDFSIGAASTCPNPASAASSALSSLASCTYSLNFKPTALGTRSGTLTVTDNAVNPASPKVQTLYLTGTGTTAPTPAQAVLTPATLTFASQVVGTPSTPLTLTLSNAGGSPLTGIAAPSITGAQAADFASTTCGATLAAGATCNFQIAFTPAATGAATASFSLVTAAATVTSTLSGTGVAGTTSRVVWIPDYWGKLLQVRVGQSATPTAITVALPSKCNPNSVAVNAQYAFVVCNSDFGNADEILVYNAAVIRNAAAGNLAISPLQTWTGGGLFSHLIGSAIDASGNLWIASQQNNTIYSIAPSSFNSANPTITSELVDSPSSPAGLAFASNGSLFATGQLTGGFGIVLNMPANQFGLGVNATPGSCVTTEAGQGCTVYTGDLTDPEGLAVVGSNLWVSVNGGSSPARQIVQFPLTVIGTTDQIGTGAAFGNAGSTTASPFVCPGGMFATSLHLWINDESYNESAPIACGANNDTASQTGGIFAYTPTELTGKDTNLTDVLAFTKITGRPGFGGLWVENDQPATITAATVTLSGLAATYTGSPIPVTATTNPAGLSVNITYGGSATPPTSVGSYAIVATIASPGYTGSATGTLVISKATPTINWPATAMAVAPVTLGTAQLNATATNGAVNVAGSFVYTPPAGTVYSTPGTETLTVQFTPTDTTDYNTPAKATQTLTVTAAAATPRVVWIPDFQGQALNVEIGTGATAKLVTVALPGTCYPNSVAVQGTNAYVACTIYNADKDEILVYNATTIHNAAAGALTLAPTKTITNANFNGLIGLAFDASGNLWVASGGNFANNGTIEEISSATLNTATPSVSVAIPNGVNGLLFPTGLAFNTDGSLWVTDNNGILLNFPATQLTKGAAAVPAYCIATTDIEDGGATCQTQNGIFPSPEGVAVFNGEVWVANNNQGGGGTSPGVSVTGFSFTPGVAGQPGTLAVKETYGTAAGKPFSCPGGLFAGSVHLWVNDESYGEANPQCGANGDVAPNVGGVFAFTPTELTAASTAATPVYTNVTSRPGFGGIFVENDQ
jgi:GH18 family chitinase/sugar lactone lactonase YvrE